MLLPGTRHSIAIAILGCLSVYGDVDLQAMIDSSPVVQIPAGEYSISSSLFVRQDGASIACEPGAVLRADGFRGALLVARNVANVRISGCRFDGVDAGANGGALLQFEAVRGLVLSGLTVQNTVAGMYGILIAGGAGVRVEDSRLEQIRGPGISVAEGSSEVEILRNVVDATASTDGGLSGSAIEVKARGGSVTDISGVTIRGNKVRVTTGFCFEAGRFGGSGRLSGVRIVDGNECRVVSLPGADSACGSRIRAKTCGGYSFDAVSDSEIVGNAYDAAGQAVDIAAIELVQCVRCTVSANVLVGDTSATASGSAGISANCSGCLISGNQIMNLGPVLANALIDLHTIPEFRHIDGNTVTGNTLTLPAGGTGIKGIYVNCNHNGGSAAGTQIAANRIVGAAGSGQGIVLAANAGGCNIADSEVLANTLLNLRTGLLVFRAASITWGYNRLSSVQTPVLNDGGSNLLP